MLESIIKKLCVKNIREKNKILIMPLLEKDLKTSGEKPTVEEGDSQQFQ
jgi:hypothetical protein